jgi:transcriptional regulator with XRE-family HTH domain
MENGSFTTPEWAQKIGAQVRAQRLRLNLEQATVAGRAGISVNAVKHLESGQGATVKTLIKVLKVLGRVEWLSTLAPPITISPIQMLSRTPDRQRARRKGEGGD